MNTQIHFLASSYAAQMKSHKPKPPSSICAAWLTPTASAAPPVWIGGDAVAETETLPPVGGGGGRPEGVYTAEDVALELATGGVYGALLDDAGDDAGAEADVELTAGTEVATLDGATTVLVDGVPGRMMLRLMVAPHSASGVPLGQQPALVQ